MDSRGFRQVSLLTAFHLYNVSSGSRREAAAHHTKSPKISFYPITKREKKQPEVSSDQQPSPAKEELPEEELPEGFISIANFLDTYNFSPEERSYFEEMIYQDRTRVQRAHQRALETQKFLERMDREKREREEETRKQHELEMEDEVDDEGEKKAPWWDLFS